MGLLVYRIFSGFHGWCPTWNPFCLANSWSSLVLNFLLKDGFWFGSSKGCLLSLKAGLWHVTARLGRPGFAWWAAHCHLGSFGTGLKAPKSKELTCSPAESFLRIWGRNSRAPLGDPSCPNQASLIVWARPSNFAVIWLRHKKSIWDWFLIDPFF